MDYRAGWWGAGDCTRRGAAARGIGTPVMSPDDLTMVDFGTQYTTRTITKKYEVQNRGRKTRKLVWQVSRFVLRFCTAKCVALCVLDSRSFRCAENSG